MPEAIPNSSFLLQLLIACAFVIWIVMNCIKLAHLLGGRKEVHKAEVTLASDYASKADFEELEKKVERNEEAGAARRRAIYEKMEAISKETQGKLEAMRMEIKGDIRGLSQLLTEVIRK